MKNLLNAVVVFVFCFFAGDSFGQATTGTIVESTPFTLTFDHTALYSVRLFKNGTLLKTYATNEVSLLTAGSPLNSYKISVVGQPKSSAIVWTAVAVDSDGIESDPSPTLTTTVKPKSPGNLKALTTGSL